ncbi:MAG: hypothetical protein HYS27_19595 [Deltaproteobacteria bacterium]|nr:hypothetical protein [Deltaproteobacteria bacterium]
MNYPRPAGLAPLFLAFAVACDVTPPVPPPPNAEDVYACGLHEDVETPDNFLVFDKESEGLALLIVRKWEEQGAGMSAIYSLAAFAITHEDTTRCLNDTALFDYQSSHHNWMDEATAEVDELTWTLGISFQPEDDPVTSPWVWTFPLEATDAAGATAVGPVLLDLVEGNP